MDLLDMLNVMSFVIGIMNYNENITQGDMQNIAQALNENTSIGIKDIHEHLREQDEKISEILELLKGVGNDAV
jgi:hypothetical protein